MLAGGVAIGAYRVLHKIGEGGMGTVYLGEHTLLGRRAAIKVLLPSFSANEDIVKRFFNEARAVTPDRRPRHRPGLRLWLSHRRQRLYRDGVARWRGEGLVVLGRF